MIYCKTFIKNDTPWMQNVDFSEAGTHVPEARFCIQQWSHLAQAVCVGRVETA
jgi:hypothetical protein